MTQGLDQKLKQYKILMDPHGTKWLPELQTLHPYMTASKAGGRGRMGKDNFCPKTVSFQEGKPFPETPLAYISKVKTDLHTDL